MFSLIPLNSDVFTVVSDMFTCTDRQTSAFQCPRLTPAGLRSASLEAADMKSHKWWRQSRWWSEEEESTSPPASRPAAPWRLPDDSWSCCSPARFAWEDRRMWENVTGPYFLAPVEPQRQNNGQFVDGLKCAEKTLNVKQSKLCVWNHSAGFSQRDEASCRLVRQLLTEWPWGKARRCRGTRWWRRPLRSLFQWWQRQNAAARDLQETQRLTVKRSKEIKNM